MTDQTATLRWKFYDPATPETWYHPINPNDSNSPLQEASFVSAGSNSDGVVRVRREIPKDPREWTFGGVIHTQAHHDQLDRWARKKRVIQITTHQNQTFSVFITSFDPTDRRPTPSKPWRMEYKMTVLVLKQVS